MKNTERKAIIEWARETGADDETLGKIEGILDDVDALDVMGTVDVDKAFSRTKLKIKKQRRAKVLRIMAVGISSAAAAVGILFGSYALFKPDAPLPLMSELKVSPGMTGKFVMPDSTVVYLNGGSTLSYTNGYNRKTRTVNLVGEAYFDVRKDTGKPFVVNTPSESSVTVYGTRFNVDSYETDGCTVTLLNGSVGFRYPDEADGYDEVKLRPGERLVYDKAANMADVTRTDTGSAIAWVEGKIILNGTSLSEILDILSKRYSVKFDVRNPDYLNYTYSGGKFTMFSLENVLEMLKYSSSFEWEYAGSTVAGDSIRTITIY